MSNLKFNSNRRVAMTCPCGKGNHDGKFSPFVGHTDKGHCYGCGETFFPDSKNSKADNIRKPPETEVSLSHIEVSVLRQSLGRYKDNILYQYLCQITNSEIADFTKKRYFIGTSQYWKGATVFWQIDVNGKIRDGKILQYFLRPDESCFTKVNCGRVKENVPPVKWVNKLLRLKDYNLRQCFYGEHLLSQFPNHKIGILESEKSAIIASVYHPDLIWLACGGADGLTKQKAEVLDGRDITLFPDLGKFALWNEKASELRKLFGKGKVRVSDVLERRATQEDRERGLDLADFLLRQDWKTYGK